MDGDTIMTDVGTPEQPQFRAKVKESKLSALVRVTHVDLQELVQTFLSHHPNPHDLNAVSEIFRDAASFTSKLALDSLAHQTSYEGQSSPIHDDSELSLLDLQLLGEIPFEDGENGLLQQPSLMDNEVGSSNATRSEQKITTNDSDAGGNKMHGASNKTTDSEEFDVASGILPDDVIQSEHDKEYNENWMTKHKVPASELRRFDDGWISRYKMQQLFHCGALHKDDELVVQAKSADGTYNEHCALVTGVGPKGETKWCPEVAVLNARRIDGGHPVTVPTLCKNTEVIIEAVKSYFKDCSAATNDGYKAISVRRADHNLGTLNEIRAKYQLWEVCVRQWARRNNVKAYAGRIDPNTGTYYPHPMLKKRTPKKV